MIGMNAKRLIARLLRQSMQRGSIVEIDGLGTFVPGAGRRFRFIPETKPRVFIAYVEEDVAHANKLYERLALAGFDPWLDKRKLLPGQNWARAIETAIQSAQFVLACFSKRSVSKRGRFQCELRYALGCAARVPLDETFFIPVRLEPCMVPVHITRHLQYVNLFPSWETGFAKILETMKEEEEHRQRKRLPLTV